MTHTPGKWFVGKPDASVSPGWTPIVSPHEGCSPAFGRRIAWALGGHSYSETSEDQAARIVQCVNSHDALADILTSIVALALPDGPEPTDGMTVNLTPKLWDEIMATYRALKSASEGERS